MGTGTIFTIAGWGSAVVLAEVAASSAYRAACARWSFLPRWSPMVPDHGMLLPELSGGACLAALAFLGVFPFLTGLASAALLALAVLPLANIMRIAAKQGQAHVAGRRIASALSMCAWTARYILAEDLRTLTGRVPSLTGRVRTGNPPPGPVVPGTASPAGLRAATRSVPSVRMDDALGVTPTAAEVGTQLEAAQAMVPPEWLAVAAGVAEFEPETDEDLLFHMAGEAAGILTFADAISQRAENLVAGNGLDPAYAAGHLEYADEVADLAAATVMVTRRYHAIYGAIREWAENGGVLPHNARQWFGEDGQAAA